MAGLPTACRRYDNEDNISKSQEIYENLPGLGATKSSFTFAFCCKVSLFMDSNEFIFGSPITTHQPSSRFYLKEQICYFQCSD
jgi:hypothetical protein